MVLNYDLNNEMLREGGIELWRLKCNWAKLAHPIVVFLSDLELINTKLDKGKNSLFFSCILIIHNPPPPSLVFFFYTLIYVLSVCTFSSFPLHHVHVNWCTKTIIFFLFHVYYLNVELLVSKFNALTFFMWQVNHVYPMLKINAFAHKYFCLE